MSEPHRVQQRRTKGWRKPANTVSVARPGKYGNPYRVGELGWNPWYPEIPASAEDAVTEFRYDIEYGDGIWFERGQRHVTVDEIRRELQGKNLMCFCPLDQPCHADVLLDLANR